MPQLVVVAWISHAVIKNLHLGLESPKCLTGLDEPNGLLEKLVTGIYHWMGLFNGTQDMASPCGGALNMTSVF